MKLSRNLTQFTKTKKGTIHYLFIGLACLFSSQAQALNCEFSKLFTDNVSIPVVGLGISTAGEDVPVGKVLYSQRYFISPKTTSFECTVGTEDLGNTPYTMNAYATVAVVSTPSGPANRVDGKDVFPTNVPGIGAIIYTSGSNIEVSTFPDTWERTFSINYGTTSQGLGQLSIVKIELIKTGPIQAGTQQVQGASLPSFQFTSGSNSPIPMSNVFVNLNFVGSTTVHTKTCQLATSNIDVNLGNHAVGDFTSPGTVTEWKDFDIILQGCPPFYGYGNYNYNENTGRLTGSNAENVISIGFQSANGVIEGNPSLAKLDGGINAATGVGIELSQRNISGSIPLDGSGGFNLPNLLQEDNATYIIPLKARYVQSDTNVTAGPANGSVVFTITYL
ncbi:type 1 fimbrial protein [Klebsiella sp. RHBSTW-00215]|uniref:fimbrial protein n=1 Tax=Klebsiella sp. RHBSTW-00215 TaxID=2742640 RepID=UPI0015F5D758|nr:fimbrial protein [Klebsiella sp. RHBSTW-00215]MBA7935134.1 type 1 fimbrial protein [Klebsiella sp. RHBSTW-00215]